MNEVERDLRARRWPGAVFTLIVPGFGLVRAGLPLRGLAWFLAMQLAGCVVALLVAARPIPVWLAYAGIGALLIAAIALLKDSFRPGRMTWRLWVIFALTLGALLAMPSFPSLITAGFRVPTAAMEPTLGGAKGRAADHIFVDRISYRFSPPRRGDLVVFRTAGIAGLDRNTMFVKRLVGLPGERIEIRDGRLFANGRQLGERDGIPAITYVAAGRSEISPSGGASYTVAADGFFMLGDNSAQSFDSRYWGSVPRANIYGRVARIYYPLSRLGVPR